MSAPREDGQEAAFCHPNLTPLCPSLLLQIRKKASQAIKAHTSGLVSVDRQLSLLEQLGVVLMVRNGPALGTCFAGLGKPWPQRPRIFIRGRYRRAGSLLRSVPRPCRRFHVHLCLHSHREWGWRHARKPCVQVLQCSWRTCSTGMSCSVRSFLAHMCTGHWRGRLPRIPSGKRPAAQAPAPMCFSVRNGGRSHAHCAMPLAHTLPACVCSLLLRS